ncbi:MAG: hypothetical protein HYT94_01570 [Parcubacteria group bacterium]|nr:hypothetical protein [Parcubacteria group bacterium]
MPFLKHFTPRFLARAIATSLFTAVLAGEWDVWWHVTIGREAFWEPPHMLIYGSVSLAILLGVVGFIKTKAPAWKRIAGFLVIVPLLAPLDELWHKWFGVENLTSPLVVWALPHVLLIAAVATALVLTLPLLRKEENMEETRRMFGAMIFAALLNLGIILAIPLNPIGAYHLLGFFGSAFTAFLISFLFLSSEKWIGGFAPALLTAAFFLVLYLAGVEGREPANPHIIMNPHSYIPAWLVVFAYIIPAMFVGISSRFRLPFRGMMIGFLWGFILYAFASGFFEPALQYGTTEAIEAILSATVGGAIGAILFAKITKS